MTASCHNFEAFQKSFVVGSGLNSLYRNHCWIFFTPKMHPGIETENAVFKKNTTLKL